MCSGCGNSSSTPGESAGDAEIYSPLPVFSQSQVYVSTGTLYAFSSADGRLSLSYLSGNHSSLFASAPTIVGNRIYIAREVPSSSGSASIHAVYALRKDDGAIVWRTLVDDASPLSPLVANAMVYVSSIDHFLYALRASDGTIAWHYRASGTDTTFDVIVLDHGIIYTNASDDSFYALNATSGTLLWHRKANEDNTNGPAVANGIVYISGHGGVLALSARDGMRLWHYAINDYLTAPVVSNGVVYVIAISGSLYALRANNGTLLWQHHLPDLGFFGLYPLRVVKDIVLYAGLRLSSSSNNQAPTEESYVYALRAKDGSLIWQYKIGGRADLSLGIGDNAVYAVDIYNMLYALRISDGALLWHVQIPAS